MAKPPIRISSMELFGCEALRLDNDPNIDELTEFYLTERQKGAENGFSPIILALDRRVRWMIESNVSKYGSAEKLREEVFADSAGGRELLQRGFEDLKKQSAAYGEEDTLAEDDETLDQYLKTGGGVKQTELWSVSECAEQILNDHDTDGNGVYLVRVPAAEPWKAAAWLPFCGFNECPPVSEMIKICRFWFEKYGAAPAFISGDIMQFWLDKPISDRKTAREISHQHAVFCEEFLAESGLDSQTADIMTSNVWSFWWD